MSSDTNYLPQFLIEYNEILNSMMCLQLKVAKSGSIVYRQHGTTYFIMWILADQVEMGKYCFAIQEARGNVEYWASYMKHMGFDQYNLSMEKLNYVRNAYNQLVCLTKLNDPN